MQMILLNLPIVFGWSMEVYLIIILYACLTYLFWDWLFKKFIKKEKSRKIISGLTTIFISPIIYLKIVPIVFFIFGYLPAKEFSSEKWLDEKQNRYVLTEDLIESQILIGKTREEVETILGKHSSQYDDINHWTYYAGLKPQILNIDPYYILFIEFRNDKVINVQIEST